MKKKYTWRGQYHIALQALLKLSEGRHACDRASLHFPNWGSGFKLNTDWFKLGDAGYRAFWKLHESYVRAHQLLAYESAQEQYAMDTCQFRGECYPGHCLCEDAWESDADRVSRQAMAYEALRPIIDQELVTMVAQTVPDRYPFRTTQERFCLYNRYLANLSTFDAKWRQENPLTWEGMKLRFIEEYKRAKAKAERNVATYV